MHNTKSTMSYDFSAMSRSYKTPTDRHTFCYDKSMELKLQSLSSLDAWQQLFERNSIPELLIPLAFDRLLTLTIVDFEV